MRLKGTLVEWNDDRGFGFLEPAGGGERAFCHISQFALKTRRPKLGERLTYAVTRDERGRWRASQIKPLNALQRVKKAKVSSPVSPWVAVIGSIAFLLIVAGLAVIGRLPVFVPIVYLALSLITIVAYAFDKSAAMNRRWRTQESTLNLLALLGGWPGAWISQLLFRHKTKKSSFIVIFVLCVILNLAFLTWVVVDPDGAAAELIRMAG
jgi:uncharacterized membrane protein YsdA (DUF1294 family)/cold shock CspA family protein